MSAPLGATVAARTASISASSRRAPRSIELLLFDDVQAAGAVARRSRSIARAPHLSLLARLRARTSRPARSTPTAPTDRSRPSAGCGSTARRCCSIPTASRSPCRDRYDRDAATRPGDNAAIGDEERRRRSRRATTGKATAPLRRPFAETIIYELHVARLHPPSQLRRGRREARDLRRPDREDSLPAGPRRHRRRAAAGVSVRSAGRAGRPRELLGLPAGLVLRAASRLQLAHGAARRARRVPRHGEGAAPRRHRSDPRRRLQPHDGRRARTARRCAIAAWPTSSTTSSRRTSRATPTTPAAATR